MTARSRCAALAAALALCATAAAHELDPAYLGFAETSPGIFDVQWKVSIPGGLPNVLEPQLPGQCTLRGPARTTVVLESRVQTGEIDCPSGLAGSRIGVDGLPLTMTDALLRIDYLDGTSFTARLTAQDASVVVPAKTGVLDVVRAYIALGAEHILLGGDHLLFVLALLLLVDGLRRLVATVTAFTVAHSITLGAATLGWVRVPQAPVEATIALSILFLASELARRSAEPAEGDLAGRFPWLVAFSFGLLHGFGFAGALAGVGLPQRAIPVALLFFNIGVEIGQLLFIAAVLLLGGVLRALDPPLPRAWPRLAAYVIGSLAAFWVFERTAAFV